MNSEERVTCRTPNEGRTGVTRIPRWKYNIVRSAILTELEKSDLAFVDLTGRITEQLNVDIRKNLGSIGWHVTTVKLELEVKKEIQRYQKQGKQWLTLGNRNADV